MMAYPTRLQVVAGNDAVAKLMAAALAAQTDIEITDRAVNLNGLAGLAGTELPDAFLVQFPDRKMEMTAVAQIARGLKRPVIVVSLFLPDIAYLTQLKKLGAHDGIGLPAKCDDAARYVRHLGVKMSSLVRGSVQQWRRANKASGFADPVVRRDKLPPALTSPRVIVPIDLAGDAVDPLGCLLASVGGLADTTFLISHAQTEPERVQQWVQFLDENTDFHVKLAADNLPIHANSVIVSPAMRRLSVEGKHIRLEDPTGGENQEPGRSWYATVAEQWGPNTVVVTVGEPGGKELAELEQLRAAGVITFSQVADDAPAKVANPDYRLPLRELTETLGTVLRQRLKESS